MHDALKPHQLSGAERIAERGKLINGDPPGLGKTRTCLAAAAKMGSRRVLTVCPAIVRTHWHREAAELGLPEDMLIVRSYEEIVRGGMQLMAQLVVRERIDALIVDEFHYCKHTTSQRAKMIFGKNGYARRVAHVIPASGTPIPRGHPTEIWPVLSSVFPDVARHYGLHTKDDLVARYCVMRGAYVRGAWREKVVDIKNVEELKELLGRIMIRRSNADLPPIWWQTLRLDCDISHSDPDLSETAIANRIRTAIDAGDLEIIAADPQVSRMRRRLGQLKVAPVLELLRSQLADSEEKVCVFAYHTDVLTELYRGLLEYGVAFIDGGTTSAQRDREIEEFRSNPAVRVFLGQSRACSTGLDGLQHAAKRLLILEPDWSRDVNYQLACRLARMGQRAPTIFAQMIALAGTVDEAVVSQNAREAQMVSQLEVLPTETIVALQRQGEGEGEAT